jgi:hypothetical protein
MAIYHYNLNSFHDVAKHYDSIKPIRGTDIRPLGDRARKWEHIVKVSRNKYILTNVLTEDDPKWIYQENYKGMVDRAPVTWTRDPRTGITKLRIRNGSGTHAHTSLYSFLYRALPYSMDFVIDHGKQFVRANNEHGVFQTHFLPKSTWVHKTYYDNWKADSNKYYWAAEQTFTSRDDKVYLEFEHTEWDCHHTGNKGTKFVLVHGQHKEPVTRYRIDKQAKKKYGQACKDIVEWAWAMKDLLVDSYQNDWQVREQVREQAGECLNSNSEFCNMLLDGDDERRTPVVAWILGQISTYNWYESHTSVTDDPKKFRRQFNNQVNELAGFKTKHREFIQKDRSI